MVVTVSVHGLALDIRIERDDIFAGDAPEEVRAGRLLGETVLRALAALCAEPDASIQEVMGAFAEALNPGTD